MPAPGLENTVGLPTEFIVHLHRLNKVLESKYFLSVEHMSTGFAPWRGSRRQVHDPALGTCFGLVIGPGLAAPAQ